MNISQQLVLVSSVALVCTILLLAATVAFLWILERLRLRLRPSRAERWFRRVVFALAAVGAGGIGYALFVEPYWPEVTYHQLPTTKLPPSHHGFRIVHLSDLHSDPTPRLEDRLPELIAAQRPDLILFTGDTINTPQALPIFQECMRALGAIAPTYAVRGNWDKWYWREMDVFGNTGTIELRDQAVVIPIEGIPVTLVGLDATSPEGINQLLQSIPRDNYSILLHHYPDVIYHVSGFVDLYLAGHVHGGQVALPLYGALVTLTRHGKKFESGLYHVGGTDFYVTRGIGMEGGPIPRMRFMARPEISVLDVVPAPRPSPADASP